MAEIDDGGSTPTATGSLLSGALDYLNAEWINERVMNVADQVDEIVNRLIGKLMGSGYAPFSSPVTPEMIQKMSPGQLEAFLSTIPDEEGKAEVLAAVVKLKLPTKIMLPPQEAAKSPAPAPKLAFGPADQVNLGG